METLLQKQMFENSEFSHKIKTNFQKKILFYLKHKENLHPFFTTALSS